MRMPRSEAAARAESELKYWGYHVGKQFAADGYPEENPMLTLLCGHSDVNPLAPRFGLNIKDIPGDAWRINATVMQLHGDYRRVLLARFALPMDYATGQPIQAQVIADAMGIPVRTYFRRLEKARDRYLSLSFGIRGIPAIA